MVLLSGIVSDMTEHSSYNASLIAIIVNNSATADTDPTQRDHHIQAIASKGRMAWQRDSGYNERARVEGQFGRWKQVIGDGLRFHSDQARATEVAIAAQVLNRMLDLGRPNSVRIA